MYRPKISQLIAELQSVLDDHGDIEVIGYNEQSGELPDVGAEMNADDGEKICLLTVNSEEDD